MKFKEFKEKYKNEAKLQNVIDFLIHHGFEHKEIMFNFEDALKKEQQWLLKLNSATQTDLGQFQIIKDYMDGFKIVQLLDQQSKKYEGFEMAHCVASHSGSSKIYSLRDQNNKPHCTMEFSGKSIIQIKGKANGKVSPKYTSYVLDFLKDLNVPVNIHDMENIGYHFFDSKTKKVFEKHFINYKKIQFGSKDFFYTDISSKFDLAIPFKKLNINIFKYLCRNDQCQKGFINLLDFTDECCFGLTFNPLLEASFSGNLFAVDLIFRSKFKFFNIFESDFLDDAIEEAVAANQIKTTDYILSNAKPAWSIASLIKLALECDTTIPMLNLLHSKENCGNSFYKNAFNYFAKDYWHKPDIIDWLLTNLNNKKLTSHDSGVVDLLIVSSKHDYKQIINLLIEKNLAVNDPKINLILTAIGLLTSDKDLVDFCLKNGFKKTVKNKKNLIVWINTIHNSDLDYKQLHLWSYLCE